MKDQLDVTCYFISLIMCSTCFGLHLQEFATVLMNYHIGRLVLSSLCAGAFVAAGVWWCSFCRLKPEGWYLVVFVLQAEACYKTT